MVPKIVILLGWLTLSSWLWAADLVQPNANLHPTELESTAISNTKALQVDPNLSGLESAVARHIQETLSKLARAQQSPTTKADTLADLYGELARIYHAYALYNAAEANYQQAEQKAPIQFEWPYLLGYLLQTQGRHQEALAAYYRALVLRPKTPPLWLRIGEVYAILGQQGRAKIVWHTAKELDPIEPATHARLGELALANGEYAEALAYLHYALQRQPAADRLHYPLARALQAMGQEQQARKHLERHGTVGIKPQDAIVTALHALRRGGRIHVLRGKRAYKAGHLEEALAAYRLALAADPINTTAQIDLGTVLAAMGDKSGAIAQFSEALVNNPSNTTIHFNLGTLLAETGHWTKAVSHLRFVVVTEPEDHRAWLALAKGLRQLKKTEKALTAYQTVARLQPLEATAWLGGSGLLLEHQRYAEAVAVLRKGHEALPQNGLLAHALARMLAGVPDLALREGEVALKLAQHIYKTKPTTTHAATVAMALAEMGRCAEAASWQAQLVDAINQAGKGKRQLAHLRQIQQHYQTQRPCRYP